MYGDVLIDPTAVACALLSVGALSNSGAVNICVGLLVQTSTSMFGIHFSAELFCFPRQCQTVLSSLKGGAQKHLSILQKII